MNQEVIADSLTDNLDSKALYVLDPCLSNLESILGASVIYPMDQVIDPTEFSSVYGVGDGIAIDTAKKLAYDYGKRCVAVPASLSSHAFATTKTVLNRKLEFGKQPDTIIYDEGLLTAHPENNTYGLMSLFSTYCALLEWKEYRENAVQEEYFLRSRKILLGAVNLINRGKIDLKVLFSLLLEMGHVESEYGSRIPTRGTDLALSELIDVMPKWSDDPPLLVGIYGYNTLLSVIIMRYFYESDPEYSGYEPYPFHKLGVDLMMKYMNREVPYGTLFYDILINLPAARYNSLLTNALMSGVEFGISDRIRIRHNAYEELKTWLVQNGVPCVES